MDVFQQALDRKREEHQAARQPKETGTTVLATEINGHIVNFTFVGHVTKEYMKEAVARTRAIEDEARAVAKPGQWRLPSDEFPTYALPLPVDHGGKRSTDRISARSRTGSSGHH